VDISVVVVFFVVLYINVNNRHLNSVHELP
jgi:hypothetical protein